MGLLDEKDSYVHVNMDLFKLYPKSDSSNDMMFLRNARTEEEVYFHGPKCTLLKNYSLNDTARMKLELAFDSENVPYTKFLSRIKSTLVETLAASPSKYFSEVTLSTEQLREMLEEIILEPYRTLPSKGMVRMTVGCNARCNTKFARDHCLQAVDALGNRVEFKQITPDTVFVPVFSLRGIRVKNTQHFHIEFLLRKMVVVDRDTLLPKTCEVDLGAYEHVKDAPDEGGSAALTAPPVPTADDSQENTNKHFPRAGGDACDLEFAEYDLSIEGRADSSETPSNADACGETFKVKPPRDVYYKTLKEFKGILRAAHRAALGEWLHAHRIYNTGILLDEASTYDTDDEEDYNGYYSN